MFDFLNINYNNPWNIVVFIFLLILGAFVLIKCCNIFLDSACVIAEKFGISKVIIGLTVVAIGTSIPELTVSLVDSFSSAIDNSASNIGFANIVGSNISNILLVLSFGCIFTPIIIKKENKNNYFIMLALTMLLTVLVLFFGNNYELLRWEGVVLSLCIIMYIIYLVRGAKTQSITFQSETEHERTYKLIIKTVACIIGIAMGGSMVVYGAKGMAYNISYALGIDNGLMESLIGLTIVGVGTSLPELVTVLISSKKGENEIALGNVIGSNIFNIIFVVGLSVTIAPIKIAEYVIIDIFILVFVTLFILPFIIKGYLNRKHSILFISMYIAYMIFLILRML